ncbi:MAG TPA: phosphatase domain-containing protein [Cryomorphaceae bacterium]|nr:phosphatase domain-containing protein [Cryomorphaceae bacterium]
MPFFQNDQPIIIRHYGGFANDTHFFVKARVLEDKRIEHLESDGVLRTLHNFYKRMGSDEKIGVEVEASWAKGEELLTSDREGYVNLNRTHSLGKRPELNEWVDVNLTLRELDNDFAITNKILRPGTSAEFALISDMDDTVIHTGVASRLKWKLLVNSTFKHPFNRRPLKGVRDFYQALHQGKSGEPINPVFYVSNSPWNLHSYLTTFLNHHNFPKGPLILRDIGVNPMEHTAHGGKYGRIKQIINAFPDLKFVLSGDSAEVDTDIYLQLAREHPEQIRCIFIRTVNHKGRMKRVKELIEANRDIHVKLIRDSSEGLAFAKKMNLI